MNHLRRVAAALCFLAAALSPAGPAMSQPRQVHGSLDAFAAPGVALAWAVLRGSDEGSTEVVVRVAPDPKIYRSLSVTGVDPFTKASQLLVPAAPVDGTVTVRLPRSRFAELPRTEWSLFASRMPSASDEPALVVFYLGIPDTTPEFKDEATLQASLDERLKRARSDLREK